MVVREHLEKAGLGPMEVALGEAAFPLDLTGRKSHTGWTIPAWLT